MAIGPPTGDEKRDRRVKMAEELIDSALKAHGMKHMEIPTLGLSITQDEWTEFLRQQYLDAGWTSAEWEDAIPGDPHHPSRLIFKVNEIKK